jgi:hypothetical protein
MRDHQRGQEATCEKRAGMIYRSCADADADLAALRAIFQSSGVYSDSAGEVLELEAVREDEGGG